MDFLWLTLLGVGVGTLGTLLGIGGGFLMVPVLAALYPQAQAGPITAVSLVAIAANAASGSLASVRARRVDFRLSAALIAGAAPGAVLGAWLATGIERPLFEKLLGCVVIAGSVLLLVIGGKDELTRRAAASGERVQDPAVARLMGVAAASVAIGTASTIAGIGGGIFHVPMLVLALGIAVPRATATSQFALGVSAVVATAVHASHGSLSGWWAHAAALAAGGVAGAQIGAVLSTKTPPIVVIRLLAAVLLFVGAAIVWRSVGAR